jgi:hypothetical protein
VEHIGQHTRLTMRGFQGDIGGLTEDVDMFARNVSIRLKPNSPAAFTKQIENETIPTLRQQAGFQGEHAGVIHDSQCNS